MSWICGGPNKKTHLYISLKVLVHFNIDRWPLLRRVSSICKAKHFCHFVWDAIARNAKYAKYANVFKWKSNTRWDFWQILGPGERCVQSPLGEDYEWTFCTFSTFFHIKPNAHRIQLMVIYLSRWTFSHFGSFLRLKTYVNILNLKHLIISDKKKNLHSKIFTIVHMRTLDDISWYWWLCRSQHFCPVFLVTLPKLYMYALII